MDGRYSQALHAPLTPVSPKTSVLDRTPDTRHHNGSDTWYRLHTPMSPESMRGMDVDAGVMCNGNDSKSFERALAELVHDRKVHSAIETKYRGRGDISMAKMQPKKTLSSSSTKTSRDRNCLPGRPPQSLAATHPALYNKPPPSYQRKMLPTPPPTDYPEGKFSIQQRAKTIHELTSPSPPWRTYTDPNRQISGEPRFNDPKYRMLKMDLEPHQPKVLSPTFMIGLPCGSMIEAANQYPDSRLSHPRDAPSA